MSNLHRVRSLVFSGSHFFTPVIPDNSSTFGFSKPALLLCIVLGGMQGSLTAQPDAKSKQEQRVNRSHLLTEKMQQKVDLPAGERLLDDNIIALAAGSQANFFCDVTDVDKTTTVHSFPGTSLTQAAVERDPLKWKSNLWLQLGDMMEQSGMTHLQSAPDTILMWHPPEPLQLSREVIGDWKRRQRVLFSPAMDPSEMREAWRNYFGGLGWDGQSTDGDIKVKVADLPLPARRRVLFEAWHQLFWGAEWDCFDDQLWSQSKILVDKAFTIQGEVEEPYLSVTQGHKATVNTPFGPSNGFTAINVPLGPIASATRTDPATAIATSSELLAPLSLPAFDLAKGSPRVRPLSDATLQADASLSKEVALEVRRGSLPELLQTLSQQSGATFRSGLSGGDVLSSRRLTVKTANLSLCDTMLALSRLTGAVWTREGDAYILHDNHEDTLHLHLRQIGDPSAYRMREGTAAKVSERFHRNAPLIKDVLKTISLEQLQKTEGVPISDLPQNLQVQLRRAAQEEAARSLPVKALMAHDFLIDEDVDATQGEDGQGEGLILELRQEKDRQSFKASWSPHDSAASYVLRSVPMSSGRDLTLTLRQPDGELVSSLFNGIQWIDPPVRKR